jgi:hypothetical protein
MGIFRICIQIRAVHRWIEQLCFSSGGAVQRDAECWASPLIKWSPAGGNPADLEPEPAPAGRVDPSMRRLCRPARATWSGHRLSPQENIFPPGHAPFRHILLQMRNHFRIQLKNRDKISVNIDSGSWSIRCASYIRSV